MAKTATIAYVGIALALLLVLSGSASASGGNSANCAGSSNINDLHPNLIDYFNQVLQSANQALPAGVTISVTSTFRTFDQQQACYNEGPSVTRAGPGQSYHNYGLAFDFSLNRSNTPSSYTASLSDQNWMTAVNTFKNAGFKWGGDFQSFKDYDHLEYSFGFSVSDLLALYNSGDFVPSPYNSNNYVNLVDA